MGNGSRSARSVVLLVRVSFHIYILYHTITNIKKSNAPQLTFIFKTNRKFPNFTTLNIFKLNLI